MAITHGERTRIVVPTPETLVAQIVGSARLLLSMQPDYVGHLKGVRLFLETGMARLAVEHVDEAALTELRRLVEAQRRAVADPEEFARYDRSFHRQIAAMSGNPMFPAIIEGMFRWLGEYHRSLLRAPGAEQLTLAEHERIIDALAARDPVKAELAMRDHLTRPNVPLMESYGVGRPVVRETTSQTLRNSSDRPRRMSLDRRERTPK